MLSNEPTCKFSPAEIAEELLQVYFQSGRYVTLRVQGWSMGYTLGPSREIAVRPLVHRPRLGDVVLLKTRNTFIAHRIILTMPGGRAYITKGDNCAAADAQVSCNDILGLVIGINDGGIIRKPWHWTRPFSVFAALLSRLDNQRCPQAARLFSRIRYLSWRCGQLFRQSCAKNSTPQ